MNTTFTNQNQDETMATSDEPVENIDPLADDPAYNRTAPATIEESSPEPTDIPTPEQINEVAVKACTAKIRAALEEYDCALVVSEHRHGLVGSQSVQSAFDVRVVRVKKTPKE